ncbi:hypothetical protein CMUS01_01926 [Colletotrichum musicola]|uniref:Uncharacterized protein n=1 Tax=Colletotrichum musicola TaxID=2175873 RepID=A0A8H6U7H7_9PEZI|nr:hypothetical protein CMUS01_01926 [Colletotrichum musicola]
MRPGHSRSGVAPSGQLIVLSASRLTMERAKHRSEVKPIGLFLFAYPDDGDNEKERSIAGCLELQARMRVRLTQRRDGDVSLAATSVMMLESDWCAGAPQSLPNLNIRRRASMQAEE